MSTRLRKGQQPTKRMAHVWDASKCIACGACVMACTSSNNPDMMTREEVVGGHVILPIGGQLGPH